MPRTRTANPVEVAKAASTATLPAASKRRSQGERSAATRKKIIDAATSCVAEFGIGGATMNVIAKKAGVTWGAMQHQFGDKDRVLDAVLEEGLQELEVAFRGLRVDKPAPIDRVHELALRWGKLLHGPNYRAFVEIQQRRALDANHDTKAWGDHVGDRLAQCWSETFSDLGLSTRRLQIAQRFAFVVLSGIASEALLFPGVDRSRSHLAILAETLQRCLEIDAG